MKLILSRKGFDSSSGGCPSPILPDGSLLSLPIPDSQSSIRYGELEHSRVKPGRLVSQLTGGKIRSASRAHLDPDLARETVSRESGWRPVLGQTGAAQGHLRRQGVASGDVFLFFGLFRPVIHRNRRWRFVPGSRARHICWGWLQAGEILAVDQLDRSGHSWLNYHPHMHYPADANNTLYVASERLTLDSAATGLPGAGIFPALADPLCLTAADAKGPSDWRLPHWFYPHDRTPLSYHHKRERWRQVPGACELRCAARGQEFVLDAAEYPESLSWLHALVKAHGTG